MRNDKRLICFLKYIFCVVGQNSPFEIVDFLHILITAALTNDFVNNTTIKLQPAPNGQTVFNRLFDCTKEKVTFATFVFVFSKIVGEHIKFNKENDPSDHIRRLTLMIHQEMV